MEMKNEDFKFTGDAVEKTLYFELLCKVQGIPYTTEGPTVTVQDIDQEVMSYLLKAARASNLMKIQL